MTSLPQADCGPDSRGEREDPGDGAEVPRGGGLDLAGPPHHHRHLPPLWRLSQDRAETEGQPDGWVSQHHSQESYWPAQTVRWETNLINYISLIGQI